VRPAKADHYRTIFDAAKEAFRDSWEYSDDWFSDEDFEAWQQESAFQPELWQVAWDDGQVAGSDHEANYGSGDRTEKVSERRTSTINACRY